MKEEELERLTDKLDELLQQNILMCEGVTGLFVPGLDRKTVLDLLISRTIRHALHDDDFIDSWIAARIHDSRLRSELIPISRIKKWQRDQNGNIVHDSGRFFSIIGIKVRHRMRDVEIEWDQPIIDQPEIGVLGIIAKKINGILHFCLQAKEEPGNINSVQLAPTVQATFSNYSQAHGGKVPLFVDFFLDPHRERILFARLQTEDGGRFFYKSNRNMIILAQEPELKELPDDFIWLTLRQIGNLIKRDNLINSCTRSVLSCLL